VNFSEHCGLAAALVALFSLLVLMVGAADIGAVALFFALILWGVSHVTDPDYKPRGRL
jgi:hypothetical protein